jgi:hypothetical protein
MTDRSTPPANSSPTAHQATVSGLFHLRSGAEAAIRELKEAGFTDSQIGIALRDRGERHRFRTLGSLFVPGVGPIAVGGVLALGLAGGGVGGARGGIAGALMALGIPETAARHFDRELRTGAVLVAVDAGDRLTEALAILGRHDVDLGPAREGRLAESPAAPVFGGHSEEAEAMGRLLLDGQLAAGKTDGHRERRRRPAASYPGPERRQAQL